MGPRRCFSPLESSPGTNPRYAINAGADANRRKSCNSASTNIAVNVSMPRKQRSHPTGSRYGRSARSRSAARRVHQPRLELIDRQPIVVDDGAFGRTRPGETVDPPAVRARPVASRIVQAPPQEQLPQSMPTPLQIFRASSRARAGPGPPRRRGSAAAPRSATPRGPTPSACAHRDDSSSPAHQVSVESARAPPRRSSPAPSSSAVATRTHTARLHRTRAPVPARALELPHQSPHRLRLVGQLPRHRHRLGANQHRDEEVSLCASIPTYVVTCSMTGSLRCGAGAFGR